MRKAYRCSDGKDRHRFFGERGNRGGYYGGFSRRIRQSTFNKTYRLLEAYFPSLISMSFPTPRRKKTTAARLGGQVAFAVKKERVAALIALGEKKFQNFVGTRVGQGVPRCLFENKDSRGGSMGRVLSSLSLRFAWRQKESIKI